MVYAADAHGEGVSSDEELGLSAILHALADPTRRDILSRLRAAPQRASDLADELGASRPGLSRHVRILRGAKLLQEETDAEDGRARLLMLDCEGLAEVRAWLDEFEDVWAQQMAAFKGHVEQKMKTAQLSPPKRRKAKR